LKDLIQNLYFAIKSLPFLGGAGAAKLMLSRMFAGNYDIQPAELSHPLHVRGKSSDSLVLYATYCRGAYPVPRDESIRLVIDAGANVGYTAAHFAQAFPQAKIVALEPEASNFAMLKKNAANWSNIIPLQMGLWWRKADVTVSNAGAENWCFEFEECPAGKGTPATTIEALLSEYGSGGSVLIKMDVEGAEKKIFAEKPSWPGEIKYLYIEIHDAWKEVFDSLAAYDYSARIVDENVLVTIKSRS